MKDDDNDDDSGEEFRILNPEMLSTGDDSIWICQFDIR